MGLMFFFFVLFLFLFYSTRIEVIIWASLCFFITSGLNKSPFITATHHSHYAVDAFSAWTYALCDSIRPKLDACGIYAKPSCSTTRHHKYCVAKREVQKNSHTISIWMNLLTNTKCNKCSMWANKHCCTIFKHIRKLFERFNKLYDSLRMCNESQCTEQFHS